MNRLQSEWRRLFAVDTGVDGWPLPLLDAHGARTRALVVAWGHPADWPALRPLWEGVQTEFGWPAPLIAIDGHAAFQIWISLAKPVTTEEACTLATALARRWLPGAPAARLDIWPRPNPRTGAWLHAEPVPARQAGPQPRWSAFVAPDLAAVFGDEPALDIDPGDEAQADLVARGSCVSVASWESARQALHMGSGSAVPSPAAIPGHSTNPMADEAGRSTSGPPLATFDLGGPYSDPAAFLQAVMNHPAVPMAQRIDAARALLADPRRGAERT